MVLLKTHVIVVAAFAYLAPNPPILPFTELSEGKIRSTLKKIIEADNTTVQDCNVFLQLDHIRWKYNRMREIMYDAAGKAEDGMIVEMKHLGKMFDNMDSALDAEREKNLQEAKRLLEQEEKRMERGKREPSRNA
jgi:hypothetical protein